MVNVTSGYLIESQVWSLLQLNWAEYLALPADCYYSCSPACCSALFWGTLHVNILLTESGWLMELLCSFGFLCFLDIFSLLSWIQSCSVVLTLPVGFSSLKVVVSSSVKFITRFSVLYFLACINLKRFWIIWTHLQFQKMQRNTDCGV